VYRIVYIVQAVSRKATPRSRILILKALISLLFLSSTALLGALGALEAVVVAYSLPLESAIIESLERKS
jgi:hypothetical protein